MDGRIPDIGYRPTVPSLLRRAVDLYGDGDFVVVPDRRISFREAEERSLRLARVLLAYGVGKGTRVGIVLPTGVEWVVAWLAVTRIGALAMLLPSTYRARELRRALVIGDVAHLFAPRELFGRDYTQVLEEAVPGSTGQAEGPIRSATAPYLRRIWFDGPGGLGAGADVPAVADDLVTAVEERVSPADPLLVIFTSGSSADPKAVVHTHGAAIRKVNPELGMCLPASFPGRTFCAMPFFWVGGPQELLGALHSGATVVAQPRFDPEEALDLLETERCTSMLGWANIMDRLASDPSSGSRVLAALDVPPRPLSSRGHPRNLGMTETFGPHGNPRWFDYRVVDPENGEPLANGQEGEFLVRGFGLMAAMYKKERENVFDCDGWYHTGDRGYIEDGHIWFTGRYSETVKARGANVSPLEVERAIESLPGVSMALVVGVRDTEQGEIVAAAVVAEDGADLEVDELRSLLNRELSAYKVPSRWRLMSTDEVPWLPTGKPDKRLLAQILGNG